MQSPPRPLIHPPLPRGAARGISTAVSAGFTLVELLVVVAVIVIMMTLAVPAFNAIRGGADFATGVYNIAGMLDQARSYAAANNTYVLAGIFEASATQSASASPQIPGTGRVEMALFASKSGARPYQSLLPGNLLSWKTGLYGSGGAFEPVTALLTIQNIHLVDLQYNGSSPLALPASGGMMRPSLGASGYYYDIPNLSGASATPFAWPIGSKLLNPPPQYTFTRVIEFDPQGSVRIFNNANQASTSPDSIPQYIEIGLQPANGAYAAGPPASQSAAAGQIAAIQISGISGAVHIYRP